MSGVAARFEEFKNGTGRYERPKRAYGQSPEQVALVKRQSDALCHMRKSRDDWKERALAAEALDEPRRALRERANAAEARADAAVVTLERVARAAEALQRLAVLAEDKGLAFAAKKLREALDG